MIEEESPYDEKISPGPDTEPILLEKIRQLIEELIN
jgi:hypothetical protein